jgi:hypothetical protein
MTLIKNEQGVMKPINDIPVAGIILILDVVRINRFISLGNILPLYFIFSFINIKNYLNFLIYIRDKLNYS